MFGPLRNCIYPRIFRSVRVKNAMAKRIGTIRRSRLIMNIRVKERS